MTDRHFALKDTANLAQVALHSVPAMSEGKEVERAKIRMFGHSGKS